MKNRTKTILITFGLIVLTIVSGLVVFIFSTIVNEPNYSLIDLSKTSIDYYNMDNDIYSYDMDGYVTSIGVDLSEHNINVDFKLLKEQGIEYAFLRVAWRGYVTPTLHEDKKFKEFYKGAKDVGIKVGVYFFSQAINQEEAIEEAYYMLDIIKDLEIDTYVVYDYETIEDRQARTNDLTRDERTNNAIAFLETVKNAGYEPMLYTNYDWIKHHYKIKILQDYPIWYAQYSKHPQYKGKYYIWQYCSGAMLDGITSPDGVDLNIMIKKEETN